jgi:ATP-dependent exoDNAse (exonuclease V) alpha subunit
MYNLCKQAHKVKQEEFDTKFTDKNLVFTNNKRITVNQAMMTLKEKSNKEKKVTLPKLSYDPNSQEVRLFPRVPIIAKISDKEKEIANNQMFTVKKVTEDSIYIKDEFKREILIPINEFQRMFYVAYAITIHKCQGETYNEPYTIHEWERLDRRLKYVALSRATDKKLINII